MYDTSLAREHLDVVGGEAELAFLDELGAGR
jgi:hypothetical protein